MDLELWVISKKGLKFPRTDFGFSDTSIKVTCSSRIGGNDLRFYLFKLLREARFNIEKSKELNN